MTSPVTHPTPRPSRGEHTLAQPCTCLHTAKAPCKDAEGPLNLAEKHARTPSSIALRYSALACLAFRRQARHTRYAPRPYHAMPPRQIDDEVDVLGRLSRSLISWDPVHAFIDDCARTVGDWAALLAKLVMPAHHVTVASDDPGFVGAFSILEDVISGRQISTLLRRLAFVELIRLSETLKVIIKSERNNRLIFRPSGMSDASVVINVYQKAMRNKQLSKHNVRCVICERRRTGKRYVSLTRLSPLFLLTYFNLAKTFV